MLKKIQILIRNKVFHNFFYLNLAKGFNMLTPLLVTPLLIRTISLTNFGKISLAQVICSFFIIACNYGFDTTSVKNVSLFKDDKYKLKRIITETYYIKFFFLFCLFPIYEYISSFFFTFKEEYIHISCSYLIVVGGVLLPDFFYQGIQKMNTLILFNGLSKVILFFLLVYFIDSPRKYIYVNMLIGFSNIIVCLIGLFSLREKGLLEFVKFRLNDVSPLIKENSYLTASNLLLGAYGYSSVIVLGLTTSKEIVGLYVAMERIIFILKGFVQVFALSIFPKVCQIATNIEMTKIFYKKVISPFMVVYYFICIMLILFAPLLKDFLGITDFKFILLFRIFCISALLELILMPFNQYLLASNQNKLFFKLIIVTSLLSVIFSVIMINYWGILGGIITVISSQVFLLILHKPSTYFNKKSM